MPFDVQCSVSDCPFERQSVESLEEVFDLEDQHKEENGDQHRFNFERVEE